MADVSLYSRHNVVRRGMSASCLSIASVLLLSICLLVPARSAAQQKTGAKRAADAEWQQLLEGNERFVAGKLTHTPLVPLRESLASGQSPRIAVLSCSDSRVPPELIFDRTLGDLFMVRVAGNVADQYGIASLEYAVEHLGTKVLLVLGHEECGAVAAACSGKPADTANLRALTSSIAPVCEKNAKLPAAEQLYDSVVANVRKSAADLLAHSEVLRHAVDAGNLDLILAVYKLRSGKVVRVD
jgi:carbonic anhydrase